MRTSSTTQLGFAIAGSVVLAVALLVAAGGPAGIDPRRVALAAIVAAVMACAHAYPVDGGPRGRTALDAGVIFAAALLFSPGVAVLVVVSGVLLASVVERVRNDRVPTSDRRSHDHWVTLAVGQVALQAGVGGILLAAGGVDPTTASLATVLTIVLSAAAIWLTGVLVTAFTVAVESGVPVRHVWRRAATLRGLLDSVPHFALGFVAALVAETHFWALPLIVLPAVAWRRAVDDRVHRRSMEDFLESLADTVDARDRHTIEHSRRVAAYARKIAIELGLPKGEVDLVTRAARVHDVGNISVERSALVRDDTLTGEEWRAVKGHPAIGGDLLLRFPRYVQAAELVRRHHERIDGAGYPDGIHGERIPIGARIIAVADALDAMASTRPYRPALPEDVIRAELARQRDRQWDGRVVDALLRMVERGEITLPGDERLRDYVAREESETESLAPLELNDAPDFGYLAIPGIDVQTPVERTALETQLMHQVFHDPLTGLPNRALFMDRLEHALARIRRAPDAVAVIFADLDNFKTINDTWGHQAGDEALIEVARRMEGCLRPGDTVARLAGDELTLLVENISDINDAIVVAARVVEALSEPLSLTTAEMRVTASIGVAFSSTGREQAADLLHNADVAMYRAKKDGKAGYAIYEPGMRNDADELVELKQDIALAIENGQLRALYQPKAILDSGRIGGMEALVRWQHPQRGLILPSEFLPAAEHTGIVSAIDRWVLRDACRQVRAWRMAQAGGPPLVVSVNISARTFSSPGFPEELATITAEFRLEPRALMLEVTEDVAMADPDAAIERFARLKEQGVLLAIDNFGAGSSSLSYLKRFPVDTLKIAKSFVDGLGYDPGDTAAVRAIIAFASTLRRSVAAEGIETAEQFFQLRGLGCDQGQGNHLAPPLTRDAISALVAGSATLPLGRIGRGSFAEPPAVAAIATTHSAHGAHRLSEAVS